MTAGGLITAGRSPVDRNVQPGELLLERGPAILRTILGSCVGATFWSARLGAGALCHGVLPLCPAVWIAGVDPAPNFRYVDFSIRYLIRQFDRLGVSRHDMEVKVFGGADVLPMGRRTGRPTVGALNCQIALDVLAEEGIVITASDLGGTRGRRIHFHTATGVVLVQRLEAWNSDHDRPTMGDSGE